MEYKETELSQWFDLSVQKPWEPGVYEVQLFDEKLIHKEPKSHNFGWFAYFDGKVFSSAVGNANRAEGKKGIAEDDGLVVAKWRGLSSDPSPKPKRKGNPRVTRYVVINKDDAPSLPIGVFESMANAQKYAENFPFVKILKIRFRTPEAK